MTTTIELHLPGLEPPDVTLAKARRRRAETRDALMDGLLAERRATIESWIATAAREWHAIQERIDASAPGEWRSHWQDAQRAVERRALRYVDLLAGRVDYSPYVPNTMTDYEADPDTGEWVHVDAVCPDFTPIDRRGMDESTLHRLDRYVSDMRNWAFEESDLTVLPVVHVATVLDRVQMQRDFTTKTWHQGTELPAYRVKSSRPLVQKPRVSRAYPGWHRIGPEWITDPDTGRKRRRTAEEQYLIPRMCTTVVQTRRNRWAVYLCHDGGREGRFTRWMPVEWFLVEPDDTVHRNPETGEEWTRHSTDILAVTLERALQVSWLKYQEVAREMGEVVEAGDPLPFDPDTLAGILDARSAEAEYRRRSSGPPPDDEG